MAFHFSTSNLQKGKILYRVYENLTKRSWLLELAFFFLSQLSNESDPFATTKNSNNNT